MPAAVLTDITVVLRGPSVLGAVPKHLTIKQERNLKGERDGCYVGNRCLVS